MGNTESVVVQKRLARFRPEERPVVEGVFDRLQGGAGGPAGKTLTLEMLQVRLLNPLNSVPSHFPHCGFNFHCNIKTSMETGRRSSYFLQDLVSAVVQILVQRGRLQGWKPDRMADGSVGVQLLSEQMCSELKPSDQGLCDVSCLEDWIFRVPQVSLYLELLVAEGLEVALSGRPTPTLLPPCRETPWKDLRSLLDPPTLMFLAPQASMGSVAPDSMVRRIHRCLSSIDAGVAAPAGKPNQSAASGAGREQLVVFLADVLRGTAEERAPLVMAMSQPASGAAASGGQVVEVSGAEGDSRCFLFTVFPKLRVYTATGYNQHFMYLNQNQQTMPNGLGMGGQHGYFGLWLDSDFGRGHSRARPKCTTYGSPQLSGDEDFTVDSMEAWAVGKPPEPEEGDDEAGGKRSILDVDPEVQAIMEMTGKTLHSQGLREPEEDQDQ
ncbi:MTOR-associated protein MEAK7 [Stegastes partitus]|uniref:MTOR-associated protein MEAK7 n=1 Tax=Stegastes partitus TaxID=144197 RepID=A0A9Y4NSB0_9TELE|nr:PREDICTED: TLD domain-containing protein 1 [Stegastes partitus]